MANREYTVTPKGEMRWAYLHKPDTQFDSNGVFHVKLRLANGSSDDLRKAIEREHKANKKDAVARNPNRKSFREFLPFKEVLNEDGLADGYEFQFKLKAVATNSKTGQEFTQRPVVVGPDKKPIPSEVTIGNGSIGKIAFETIPYFTGNNLGVSLRLRGVQVLELVEYNAGGNDMFSVEEGYSIVTSSKANEEQEAEMFEEEETSNQKGEDEEDF
jgi:hypothetical protein|tara:strand:- start:6146 stop:6790 length:645 start_codon:yes stop_codon:yes gene_type:complete